MPRNTSIWSEVNVIGRLWMPGQTAAYSYPLDARALWQLRDEDRKPLDAVTREDVAAWLATHAGDFSEILDFEALLSEGDQDHDLPWADPENETVYLDCMYPEEA